MSNSESQIPEGFVTIVKDFLSDILNTYPDYAESAFSASLKKIVVSDVNDCVPETMNVYEHCVKVLPERFFDILYKNAEMFSKEDVNTEFIPGIDFRVLWNSEGVTETIHETLWKYLQLLVFILVGKINSGETFGDTAKLFEAINEDDLKQKLEETMEQMKDMFGDLGEESANNINLDDLPDPSEIHDHINGLLDGKLGRLAKEIAEETAQDLELEMDEGANVNDVFQKLFRNPGKLMNLVKSVGNKLDSKIKSGDIKESELMQEASEIMEKMKNMPGMNDIQDLLKKMGVPGADNKRNVSAIKSQLETNQRQSKQRERMLKKLEQNRLTRAQQAAGITLEQSVPATFDGTTFSTGEKVERSSINSHKSNKKKRRKKKKKPPHATSNKSTTPEQSASTSC